MSNVKKLLVALVALLMSSFALAGPASAAQTAYPEPTDVQVTITLSATSLVGGADLTITVTAMAGSTPVPGTTTVKAFGKTYTGSKVTVTTPVVTEKTVETVTANFVPDDLAPVAYHGAKQQSKVVSAVYVSGQNSSVVSAAYRSASASAQVTLLPKGTQNSGVLPNTGGVNAWYILAALVLLGFGATAVTVGRKRTKHSS